MPLHPVESYTCIVSYLPVKKFGASIATDCPALTRGDGPGIGSGTRGAGSNRVFRQRRVAVGVTSGVLNLMGVYYFLQPRMPYLSSGSCVRNTGRAISL